MRLSQALIVAGKDFATFRRRRNIIYSAFVLPFIVAILFTLVTRFIVEKGGPASSALPMLLPAFSFFFLTLAGLLPTTLAAYSIVGEKTEKSLEPLLATPTTDSEILFGKGIASLVPPLVAILAASVVFMALSDAVTVGKLGYYFFPNWNAALVLFVMVPLGTVMSVEWGVLISSKVSDVRIAQQLGSLLTLPFAALYISGEIGLVDLGVTTNLLEISAVLALVDFVSLFVVRSSFRAEAILTRWK